jgi:hypothetical protein
VVAVLALRQKIKVRLILVRCIISQRKLDGATVDATVLAVRAFEAIEPGDTSEELALNCCRALRCVGSQTLEDRFARAAIVGHLNI